MIQYLVFVGAAINLIGSSSYIYAIFKGRVKPNRVSWLMWSVAPLIASAAGLSGGAGWAVLPVFMSGFCPFLIFIASFFNKDAYWHLNFFDYACGFLSLLALIFWILTKDPTIAIIFAIISDGLAATPTIKKAWVSPESESAIPFVAGAISALSSVFAIKTWDFVSYAFPAYLVLVCMIIIFAIYRKRVGGLKKA